MKTFLLVFVSLAAMLMTGCYHIYDGNPRYRHRTIHSSHKSVVIHKPVIVREHVIVRPVIKKVVRPKNLRINDNRHRNGNRRHHDDKRDDIRPHHKRPDHHQQRNRRYKRYWD
jgi:hypothetical protein